MCYAEGGPFQKLCCGHVFCKGCIKNWYLKGSNGTACPMCRKPVYWRGFHEVREEWNDEAYENKCDEVFGEALDEAFAEAQEYANEFAPKWRRRIFMDVIEDFVLIEKTYRFLKNEGVHPEDMSDVFYYGDYYSDRHMNKMLYLDEPPKSLATRYPWLRQGMAGSQKRVRAWEDPWVTVSFYIEV